MFKPTFLTLFLLAAIPSHAHGAEEISLLCDPDAIVEFSAKLFSADKITFESDETFDVPWTGKEAKISGRALKEKFGEGDAQELSDESSFKTFSGAERTIHIERTLFSKKEKGGVVIVESVSPQIYHCRRL